MNNDRQFLRIKKLVGDGIIFAAAKHNFRQLPVEHHIDASKSCQNVILAGAATATGVSNEADSLMRAAGVGTLRKDAVRGLEIIVSLPPSSRIDQSVFFVDCLEWAKGFYGLPVLSCVVHNDESSPHAHIVLLPLMIDGRMNGGRIMGGRASLQAMQSSFYAQVGQTYGLTRPTASKRIPASARIMAASMVMSALQDCPELLDRPDVEAALKSLIHRNPERVCKAMSIDFGANAKSIDIGQESPKKPKVYLCVDIDRESPPIASPDHYSRTRDSDESAQAWDSNTGEFIRPPVRKSSSRQAAQEEINRALRSMYH